MSRPSRPSARATGASNRSRGQALVEFALIAPVFFALLFGLVDMSRAVYSWNTVSEAAREGARVAAVQASWIGETGTNCLIPRPDVVAAPAPACPTNETDLKTRVVAAVNRNLGAMGTIDVSGVTVACNGAACSSATKNGDTVTVTVRYRYQPITPIVGQIVPRIDMSASASMTIN